jgi:hypothetical protein
LPEQGRQRFVHFYIAVVQPTSRSNYHYSA